MHTSLLKKKTGTRMGKKLLFIATSFFLSQQLVAADWYVNDASTTGDVFTTAIGNNANPGTAAAPFATVAAAIAVAGSGDFIYVDAGTYTEGDIFVTKPLTLRGAKFGVAAGPMAVPPGRGTNESIISGGGIYYGQSIDNITVDGFTIDLGTGIRGIEARGLNSTVINNIVTGIVNPLIQQAGISTRANAPLRLHSFLVQFNNVTNCRNGYFIDGNLENPSEVSFNYASGCFTAGFQMVASNNHTVRANVSENNAQGLLVTRGNTIIEQNTFSNNSVAGIRLAGTAALSGNNIQFNYFQNNAVGIALTDPNAGAVNNQAHFNSFTGNTANIGSLHAADFNATCNWYGTTDLPTITASITGPVTFVPYLNDGTDTDPVAPGFQPTTTCIVPVILTYFNAAVKNYDVQLSWQTATEVNSSHFIIEKSADQQSFSEAGRVAANGFSDTRVNYNFTDNKPTVFDRPVFYRLKMVDRDGSYKYSKIISVVLKASGSYVQNVFPNPVNPGGIVKASFISATPQVIAVWLYNSTGVAILQKQMAVAKGVTVLAFDIPSTVAKGSYYLLFRSGSQLHKVPVAIQ